MATDLPLIDLLGVPVRIACSDDAHRERLTLCYSRSTATRLDRPLSASLTADGDGWLIRVEGREDRREEGWIEAVRGFNHELMHGVMLEAMAYYYVHAAVVSFGERAVVLPGLSQAGKSTLALALIQRGAHFLSDELLAYDPEAERAVAFPRALKIRDVCEPYFPAFASHWQGTGEGRFLPFDALPEDAVRAHAEVAAVVSPRWTPPEEAGEDPIDACMPITPGQALLDLTTSSLNFGTHRTQSLDCLKSLVEGAASARLAWQDPHRAAEAIEALVTGASP